MKTMGAEILRSWVSMVALSGEEIRIGKEILSRVSEAYRKIRNTFRYFSRIFTISIRTGITVADDRRNHSIVWAMQEPVGSDEPRVESLRPV